MLAAAALGIAMIQDEGASAETLMQADIVVASMQEALDLLANPDRLKANLRS